MKERKLYILVPLMAFFPVFLSKRTYILILPRDAQIMSYRDVYVKKKNYLGIHLRFVYVHYTSITICCAYVCMYLYLTENILKGYIFK